MRCSPRERTNERTGAVRPFVGRITKPREFHLAKGLRGRGSQAGKVSLGNVGRRSVDGEFRAPPRAAAQSRIIPFASRRGHTGDVTRAMENLERSGAERRGRITSVAIKPNFPVLSQCLERLRGVSRFSLRREALFLRCVVPRRSRWKSGRGRDEPEGACNAKPTRCVVAREKGRIQETRQRAANKDVEGHGVIGISGAFR